MALDRPVVGKETVMVCPAWKQWLVIGVLAWAVGGCSEARRTTPVVHCPDLVGGCAVTLASQPVQVRFSAPPSALQPFNVQVNALSATRVSANFRMVGMDMGRNRYQLVRESGGRWLGHVILPVCVAGRSDWVMTLTVDGSAVDIPFTAVKPY